MVLVLCKLNKSLSQINEAQWLDRNLAVHFSGARLLLVVYLHGAKTRSELVRGLLLTY